MKILLASQSPRRIELLENLGYEFSVVGIDCDETYPATLPIDNITAFLAELKANSYGMLAHDEVLITADTLVAQDTEVLGKPKDEYEAKKMLQKLSGKKHQVYTSICLKTLNQMVTKTDVAQVEFLEISSEEIDFYIQNYKPFDKAGSYGIQEGLGMAKISKIEGSYYTIMGFPTHLVYKSLKELNI